MNVEDTTPEHNAFRLSATEAAIAGLESFRHVASTGSTNTDLADEARAGRLEPSVLVTDFQSKGRGRLDRAWEASSGQHLLVSFRLPVDAGAPSDVVNAVAAAARGAADGLIDPSVAFKWPNDLVVVDGPKLGKLAGVLAEYVPGEPGIVVVGVGLNVGPIAVDGATSVADCGGNPDRDLVLASLIRGLPHRLTHRDAVEHELRHHSATLGTQVKVLLPDGLVLTGAAIDLDRDGRLLVNDGETVHAVSVGDVVHLRPDT